MATSQATRELRSAIHAFAARHGRPPTILFDADGVLYEWETSFVQTHRELYPDLVITDAGTRDRFDFFANESEERRDAALHTMREMDYSTLAPIHGAIDALNSVIEAGADVGICTSPTVDNNYCESAKKVSIVRDFGIDFAGTRLFIMRDKTYALGDILIDDKPEVTGRRTPTWAHVRYTQLYNEHLDGARIDDWSGDQWVHVLTETVRALTETPAMAVSA